MISMFSASGLLLIEFIRDSVFFIQKPIIEAERVSSLSLFQSSPAVFPLMLRYPILKGLRLE